MGNSLQTGVVTVKKTTTGRKIAGKVILYLILILVAVLCAGPFLWMLSTSFKGNENIYEMSLFPRHPTFDNYVGVVQFLDLPIYIWNTVVMTVLGIVLDVLLASLCAYPLAKFDFYGKKIIAGVLIATQILPAAAGLIVNYITISGLRLMGSYWAVILPGSVAVFSIILFRQAYFSVSNEVMEASRIDGASEFKIWYKVMVPQILPAVSTVVIFDFINKWNNFLWPIIVLNPEKYPIAAALNYLGGTFNFQFGYIAAATIISIIPIILVFIFFQKNYINSVAGAVKG
ncbi:putative chitobiose transport system permease protein [Paenibacillus rhizosphaerae]|uniref:Putative chitobiose transport system permease protein n=1 Tax=Paenibacillus rhizosphaerae TaxID=297318 RepID=A0A839TRZ9_9BACL|nr:carbohydrate ABC transporter permease [Paenibacillus rhizosphaerae]MBB3128430.1 putative chitobiose transport system permease protein [Paenibacillus rhizosphaerae]